MALSCGARRRVDETSRFPDHALAEIADALHAGSAIRPRRIERAGQIDRPASRFDQHRFKAEPARVHCGIIHAKVGG